MTILDFWTIVIAGALALSAPIIIAGIGEIFLERAGGFNVGIEGMMLMGAVAGVLGSGVGGVWVGLAAAVAVGAVAGAALGVASWIGKADIVIVGIAIGIIGAGLSIFVFQWLNPAGSTNRVVDTQPALHLPLVEHIPLFGRGLADAGVFFHLALALVVASWIILQHTRFGLRLRAVGEDPAVAATRGFSPVRFQVAAAVIAGGLAGLAGATVPLAGIGTFSPGMTGGAGFIALAVVIIARRNPFGLVGGALVFALFNSLALLAQTRDLQLPVELYQALPYVVTLLVLCVVSRRAVTRPSRKKALL